MSAIKLLFSRLKERRAAASVVLEPCRRAVIVAKEQEAKRRASFESRIQSYVNGVIDDIKNERIFRGEVVEKELRLASKFECERVADRLNDMFPGAGWKHFVGHVLCAWYQGRGCDCGGAYHGVYCRLDRLMACVERTSG